MYNIFPFIYNSVRSIFRKFVIVNITKWKTIHIIITTAFIQAKESPRVPYIIAQWSARARNSTSSKEDAPYATCSSFPLKKEKIKEINRRLIQKPIFRKVSKIKSENTFAQCSAKVTRYTTKKAIALFVICIWNRSLRNWLIVHSCQLMVMSA